MATIPFLNNAYFSSKVGIGTTLVTTARLQVAGNIDLVSTSNAAMRIYDGTTFVGGTGNGQWAYSSTYLDDYSIYGATGSKLLFSANGGSSPQMAIDNGKAGVGTVDPISRMHINVPTGVIPSSSAIASNLGLTISGSDSILDMLSTDDDSTVATSLGMGRYNATTGDLIDKWGLATWYDTGSQGSNLSDRLGIHYGTSAQPWGSSEKVSLTREGYLGIGITDPSAPVDTNGVRIGRDFSIASRATVRLDANGAATPADILFGHTAAANESSWTGVYWSLSSRGSSSDVDNSFYFYRASGSPAPYASEAVIMTFTPDLKVGINDTTPSYNLDVAGDFRNTTSARLASDSGNVGIGTSTFPFGPKVAISSSNVNTLAIQTTDAAEGTTGTILYLGTGSGTGNTYGSIRVLGTGGSANADLVFQKDGGNVGMGTTTPFTNGATSKGLNVDYGSHSTILIGDGANKGGVIQSSDGKRRLIIGANVYDSPTNSWTRYVGKPAALVDVYAGSDNEGAFVSLNAEDDTAGFPVARLVADGGTGSITLKAYTSTNHVATPSYMLGVDSTGKIVKTNSFKVGDDTAAASADKVGTMRYRVATDEPVPITGTDLVTNGDLASSTGWYSQNSGSINNATGVATVPGAGSLSSTGAYWSLYQTNVMASNKTYMLRFQARRDSGSNVDMYAGWGYSNQFNQLVTTDWVQYEVVFTTTAQNWNALTFGGAVGATFEVKDISVIEVTEEDASYADMCMQTGASAYEWVNIVRNTY